MRATINQDHRYGHVVRVARCAELLAQRHHVPTKKARLAGLLHDLARLYSGPQLLQECRVRQIAIGEFERRHPIVLHAPLGAALAREDFDVEDDEVLSAIAKHTVGAGDMSPLDCVVYLADSLEPDRDFPERAALWDLATRDLRAAMQATIGHSLRYLERKGFEPSPATIAAAAAFGGA